MQISNNEIFMDDSLRVKIKIENTGIISGEEIVQLYITDEFASVTLPDLELKGFKKISLNSGEIKEVEFVITKELLSFYDSKNNFVAESGGFKVSVGTNSKSLQSIKFKLLKK